MNDRRALRRVAAPALACALLGSLFGCRETARRAGERTRGPTLPPMPSSWRWQPARPHPSRGGLRRRPTEAGGRRPRSPRACSTTPRCGPPAKASGVSSISTESVWAMVPARGPRVRPSPDGSRRLPGTPAPEAAREGAFRVVDARGARRGPRRHRRAVPGSHLASPLRGCDDRRGGPRAAREAFPRATAAFSRLVHLETLELQPESEATRIRVGLRIRPDGIRGIAPRYAAFLDEYMAPVKASLTVADVTGASWWTTSLAEGLWSIGLRVRDGRLAPLEGPPDRRLPQRLRASFSYSTRAGILTVGVERSGCRRGAHPISARGGLRRPLRRGTRLAAAISPGAAHQRLPAFSVRRSGLRVRLLAPRADRRADPDLRDYRARVRESWVVRWLGGLSNHAFIDSGKEPRPRPTSSTGSASTRCATTWSPSST